MKSRKLLFTGLIVVAVVVAVVAVRFRSGSGANEAGTSRAGAPAAKKGAGSGGPLPVYVHELKPRELAEQVTATGTMVAEEAVDLVSELSAKVVRVAFEEGSRVKAGDVLVKLDDTELRVELARAESRIALARQQAARQATLIEGGGTTRENLDRGIL